MKLISDPIKNCAVEACCVFGSIEQREAVASCVSTDLCSPVQAMATAAVLLEHYSLAPKDTMEHFRVNQAPAALATLWPLSLGLSAAQGADIAQCFLDQFDLVAPAGSLSAYATEIARLARIQ